MFKTSGKKKLCLEFLDKRKQYIRLEILSSRTYTLSRSTTRKRYPKLIESFLYLKFPIYSISQNMAKKQMRQKTLAKQDSRKEQANSPMKSPMPREKKKYYKYSIISFLDTSFEGTKQILWLFSLGYLLVLKMMQLVNKSKQVAGCHLCSSLHAFSLASLVPP